VADPTDKSELRSAVNRLSTLGAGQEQLQAEVTAIRGALKSVQLMLVYIIALAVILYMLLAKKGASL
jgi:hypothetical protein